MRIFIYNLIYILGFLIYIPILFWKKKWHPGFWMRLGLKPLPAHLSNSDNIWIHAVSVGEVLVAIPLLEQLAQKYPRYKIVCSVVTITGYKLAQKRLQGLATVIFAPLDATFLAKKYVKRIQPKCYVATETEIWPGLYHVLNQYKVPIIIVNGRISEKSLNGYLRTVNIIRPTVQYVQKFGMQTAEYARRIEALGASKDRIQVMGNMKFDALGLVDSYKCADLGYDANDCIWVVGSSHPGEEEIVLKIFQTLTVKHPHLKLLMAPRHVERSADVKELIESQGLKVAMWSDQKNSSEKIDDRVVLVDTIGDLSRLYAMASVVFIGKSLVQGGGQNMLEPVYYGVPTIVGPYTENFTEIVQMLVEEKALLQVDSHAELELMVDKVLADTVFTDHLRAQAEGVIENNKGASDKALAMIAEFLPQASAR